MRARRWGRGAAGPLVVGTVLLAAGCSPDLPDLDDPPPVRIAGAPCPTAPKSSPKEPVLRMWCRLERGDIAGAEAAYDPRARKALGPVLTETLKALREHHAYRRAAIVDVQQSKKLGPRAVVQVGRSLEKLSRGWYRLARQRSGWAITWDTTLRFALFGYLQPDQVPVPVRLPGAKRDAVVAAVRRYDGLFVEAPGSHRDERSAR
jgi:hypothetical protein